MSKVRRNYYQILGVPRSATDQQIGTAYRALAIKSHPDTSPDRCDTASEFKRATEAFQALSDPAKRRHYDCLIRQSRTGQRLRLRLDPNAPQMDSPYRESRADVFDRWSWIVRSLPASGKDCFYPTTGPAGAMPLELIQAELPVLPEEARNGANVAVALTIGRHCALCGGSGQDERGVCGTCNGDGVVVQHRSIAVQLPIGIVDGSILHFSNVASSSKRYDIKLCVRIQPCW